MARRTRLTVYVDKAVMETPSELVDAVMAHMIKKAGECKDADAAASKGVGIRERKQFLTAYIRAADDKAKLAVIGEWVLVRDVMTYPFRDNDKKGVDIDEDTGDSGGISMDDSTDGKQE